MKPPQFKNTYCLTPGILTGYLRKRFNASVGLTNDTEKWHYQIWDFGIDARNSMIKDEAFLTATSWLECRRSEGAGEALGSGIGTRLYAIGCWFEPRRWLIFSASTSVAWYRTPFWSNRISIYGFCIRTWSTFLYTLLNVIMSSASEYMRWRMPCLS